MFPEDDSEPEVVYDSDAEHDQEYTEKDALREAGKKTLDEDSPEEDDEDDDIPPQDHISKPSKRNKKDAAARPLQYDPPEQMAEFCREYRERRLEDMTEELEMFDEENGEYQWTQTDEDMEEIEKAILSRCVQTIQITITIKQ